MKTYYNQLNIKFAAIALLLLASATGCKKFLDTSRQGEYNTENYPYPKGGGPYDSELFGAYNDLRSYDVHCTGFFLATSVRSDDADKGSSATDGVPNGSTMDLFPVSPTNSYINGMWNGYYTLITKCNNLIDKIKNDADVVATEAQKNQAEGEAKFLRAYAYFNMVRLFGRIQLIDRKLATGETVPQTTPANIYPLIETDLQFAAMHLPPNWDAKFVGRLTKGAANGLLAKVYLTQQKWGAAMAAANLVMTSGQYNLSTPYNTIFGEAGENSKESVFEVQATSSAAVPTDNGAELTQWQGVRSGGIWNLGYGWNVPNANLEAAYEPNDPRKARTILYRSTATTTYRTVYDEVTPTTGWENPMYNHKAYTSPAFRSLYNNRAGRWMNIRILRYADVVLMYAEAANEVGGTVNFTAAKDALNSIRLRARTGAPAGTLPDVPFVDQEQLRQAIRQERRIELAMEYDRFFDLVRWGISGSVLPAAGRPNFIAARDNWLPIPLTQIDLSKEPNKLTQNPVY